MEERREDTKIKGWENKEIKGTTGWEFREIKGDRGLRNNGLVGQGKGHGEGGWVNRRGLGWREGGCEKPNGEHRGEENHKLLTTSPKRSKGEKYND